MFPSSCHLFVVGRSVPSAWAMSARVQRKGEVDCVQSSHEKGLPEGGNAGSAIGSSPSVGVFPSSLSDSVLCEKLDKPRMCVSPQEM